MRALHEPQHVLTCVECALTILDVFCRGMASKNAADTSRDDAGQPPGKRTPSALVPRADSAGMQIAQFKAPKPLKPKRRILEEEEFVSALESIITRDFFPNLPKLQAQHEYLQALEANDLDRLRDISIRYQTPLRGSQTPAGFETPSLAGTPRHRGHHDHDDASSVAPESHTGAANGEDAKPKIDLSLSLNDFLHKYTSEDNESFEEIIEDTRAKLRTKYQWLYEQSERQQQLLALTSANAERKLALKDAGKAVPLDTWQYTPANALMYFPEGAAMTPDEAVAHSKKKIVINHSSTRFEHNPYALSTSSQAPDTGSTNQPQDDALAARPARGFATEHQIDTSSGSPRVNGYGFMSTPSPAPGSDAPPLMTWGVINGTPFRLDAGDTAPASGPLFHIPEPSQRDKLGIQLADKLLEKNRKAKAKAASALGSPGKARVPGTPNSLSRLSPAAQTLGRSVLGSASPANSIFRNSLTPRSSSLRNTPRSAHALTPRGSVLLGRAHTPGAAGSTPVSASITDNLLS